MKKILVLFAVIVIAAGTWLAYGSKNDNSMTAKTPLHTNILVNDKVTIQNLSFKPANITIRKGTKVTWTNRDSTNHTVTENDGKNGPSAPPISNNQEYSFTFNEVGTFHYHCSIHTEMTGSVTVTD